MMLMSASSAVISVRTPTVHALCPRQWKRYGQIGTRCILGLLLLSAAALKLNQLVVAPFPDVSGANAGILSWWTQIIILHAEALLGLWLLSGDGLRWSWPSSVVTFCVLGGASLVKLVQGETSCGCFGRLELSPWHSLAINLAALGILVVFWPPAAPAVRHRSAFRLVGVTAVLVTAVITAAFLEAQRPIPLEASTVLSEQDRPVLLRPSQWLGQPCPLPPHLVTQRDYDQGRWIIFLHRSGCSPCEKLLPEYAEVVEMVIEGAVAGSSRMLREFLASASRSSTDSTPAPDMSDVVPDDPPDLPDLPPARAPLG